MYDVSLGAVRLVIRLKAAKLRLMANEWRPVAGKRRTHRDGGVRKFPRAAKERKKRTKKTWQICPCGMTDGKVVGSCRGVRTRGDLSHFHPMVVSLSPSFCTSRHLYSFSLLSSLSMFQMAVIIPDMKSHFSSAWLLQSSSL